MDGDARLSAEDFLRTRGTEEIAHPGGTLYDHLCRVADRLAAWGAPPDVQLAGLCHASYGTDGFDTALLEPSERATLVEVIGPAAEALVYWYGSCVRRAVYPRLGEPGPVPFTDRFTGTVEQPTEAELRAFVEITVANELDVLGHNPALAAEHGAALGRLFGRVRPRMSSAAWQSCQHLFDDNGDWAGEPPVGAVQIDVLDHLVLTVADLDRTVDFYRRALGMRPVSFDAGRRALAFGTSKINLHQLGAERTPRAARATPGSADLCFVAGTPLAEVLAHLAREGVPVELGPVSRTGAMGPMNSIYLRDPDGNLIEISNYP
ncbi:VOC family protein [Micromonospora sp. NBC_01699]|uniref:VOC family protein n=1 Tax=Micromonospora sp. NBC_01699 TaxID=2975984 RepID=UPI002E2C5742|nr:VOC family protein [Micromonospora sp. NBC_01699]